MNAREALSRREDIRGARGGDFGFGLFNRGLQARNGGAAYGHFAFELGQSGVEAQEFDPGHGVAGGQIGDQFLFFGQWRDHRLSHVLLGDGLGQLTTALGQAFFEHRLFGGELRAARGKDLNFGGGGNGCSFKIQG